MRQSKIEVYLHLVWATYRRLPFVTNEIESAVYRCIQNEAQQVGCEVLAIGGMPDHVHLIVKFPATIDIARLMNQIKGVSSHFIRQQLSDKEGFTWQSGYSVHSITPNQVDPVVAYVRNQKQHHAEKTLHPRWEAMD